MSFLIPEIIAWAIYPFHVSFYLYCLIDSIKKYRLVCSFRNNPERRTRLQFWRISVYSQFIYFMRSMTIWSFTLKNRYKYIKILSTIAFGLSPAYSLFFFISIINSYKAFYLMLNEGEKWIDVIQLLTPYLLLIPFFIARWSFSIFEIFKFLFYFQIESNELKGKSEIYPVLINKIRLTQFNHIFHSQATLSHELIFGIFTLIALIEYIRIEKKVLRYLVKNDIFGDSIDMLKKDWKRFGTMMILTEILNLVCTFGAVYDMFFSTGKYDKFFPSYEIDARQYLENGKIPDGMIIVSNLNVMDFICDFVSTITIRFFAPCRHISK